MKKQLILICFFIVFLCIIELVTANDFVPYANNFTFRDTLIKISFLIIGTFALFFFVIKYETSKAKSKILKERYRKERYRKERLLKKNMNI